MKKLRKPSLLLALLLALILVLSQTSAAFAGVDTPKSICEANGGLWSEGVVSLPSPHALARPALNGVGLNGTCYYPNGNLVARSVCGPSHTLAQEYSGGSLTSQTCTFVGIPYFYGLCNDRQEGSSDESVTLSPCGFRNGSVTFEPGSCEGECTVGAGLPSNAKKTLPVTSLDTLYVRVVDEDGQPSNDSYTVCFDNPFNLTLTIYRFVSGGWRALVTSSSNPICASASGDGAFYLGFPE